MSEFSHTRFSVLDLAPVRLGGSIAESFQNTADLAQHAESWGYTRFWLAEHHNMAGIASAATSVLIGHVAGKTSRIRVGSGGVMLPNHAPLVIAEQFGTLETLYPGRIDLGLGRAPGTDGVTVRALHRDPMNAALDFPDQVRELLQYLGPDDPRRQVRAVPGANTNVPVWLLGSSTFSAQLAASLGLPFAFAAHFAPQQMDEAFEMYRRRFVPSPWLEQPYSMVCVPVIAAETDEEAARLATTIFQKFLNLIRGKPFLSAPPVSSMKALWSEPEQRLTEMRLAELIAGSRASVERGLKRLLTATGVDEIMITTDVYEHALRLRSYRIVAEIAGLKSLPADREPQLAGNTI